MKKRRVISSISMLCSFAGVILLGYLISQGELVPLENPMQGIQELKRNILADLFYKEIADRTGLDMDVIMESIDEEDIETVKEVMDSYSIKESIEFLKVISDGENFYEIISGDFSSEPGKEEELQAILKKYEAYFGDLNLETIKETIEEKQEDVP